MVETKRGAVVMKIGKITIDVKLFVNLPNAILNISIHSYE